MSDRLPYDWRDVLRFAGYEGCTGDEIPDWVSAVWIGYSAFATKRVFNATNAAGPEFRVQLDAAHRLGGHRVVEALVDNLLAQGGGA